MSTLTNNRLPCLVHTGLGFDGLWSPNKGALCLWVREVRRTAMHLTYTFWCTRRCWAHLTIAPRFFAPCLSVSDSHVNTPPAFTRREGVIRCISPLFFVCFLTLHDRQATTWLPIAFDNTSAGVAPPHRHQPCLSPYPLAALMGARRQKTTRPSSVLPIPPHRACSGFPTRALWFYSCL